MKLTIEKVKLGTGTYWNPHDGKCCSLGHFMKALGYDPKYDLLTMVIREDPRAAWLGDAIRDYSPAWSVITQANDRKPDNSSDRDPDYATIISEFAKHGVEVEFV